MPTILTFASGTSGIANGGFAGDLDGFMERQRDIARSVAQNARLENARILDVGCGTGWLANALLLLRASVGHRHLA